ncbi:MAG: Ig-like domain repeat protein, partial [Candidatus Hydrothermae bacterium]|nr:Ig-like domain repeat protein [Candidatus Hydrothermae bacterium]
MNQTLPNQTRDTLSLTWMPRDNLEAWAMTVDTFFWRWKNPSGEVIDSGGISSGTLIYYQDPQTLQIPTSAFPEGKYTLELIIRDRAGLLDTSRREIPLDRHPPHLQVMEPMPATWNAMDPAASTLWVNEEARMEVTFRNLVTGETLQTSTTLHPPDTLLAQGWNDTLNVVEFPGIPDGIYRLTLRLTDSAGNDTLLPGSFWIAGHAETLRVDRTSPSMTVHLPTLVMGDTTFPVNLHFPDPAVNLTGGRLIRLDPVPETLQIAIGLDSIRVTLSLPTSTAGWDPGRHTVALMLEDRAGNRVEIRQEVAFRTYGVALTHPQEGDTLPMGPTLILGRVDDPDRGQGGPLLRWNIYVRNIKDTAGMSPDVPLRGAWDTVGMTLLQNNRFPYPTPGPLAQWSPPGPGTYTLLLLARDSSWYLVDTQQVVVRRGAPAGSLEVDLEIQGRRVTRPGPPSPPAPGPLVFSPDRGETLGIRARWRGAPTAMELIMLDREGHAVWHRSLPRVVDEEGVPPVPSPGSWTLG